MPLDGKYLTVFTDASFDHTTRAYGWAAWMKFDTTTERIHGAGYTETSTQAEYLALQNAIAFLCRHPACLGRVVVLQSDCVGAIGKAEPLLERLREYGAAGAYFKHVKGHSGTDNRRSAVNTWCDRMARQEMRAQRREHHREQRQQRRYAQPLEA